MRLYTFFYTIFVTAVFGVGVFILATMLPIPGNVEVRIVESGSMEPAIHTGSVVIIRPVPEYGVGDVITFASGGAVPTTHRIVGRSEAGGFITRGDANSADDPGAVGERDVLGKVLIGIPYLGYVLQGAREPIGFAFLVLLPAFIILLESISRIVAEVRRVRREQTVRVTTDQSV